MFIPIQAVPPAHQVADRDNIIQIHSVHPEVIKLHHALYAELMHGDGPLSLAQREMIGVVVSSINACHY